MLLTECFELLLRRRFYAVDTVWHKGHGVRVITIGLPAFELLFAFLAKRDDGIAFAVHHGNDTLDDIDVPLHALAARAVHFHEFAHILAVDAHGKRQQGNQKQQTRQ